MSWGLSKELQNPPPLRRSSRRSAAREAISAITEGKKLGVHAPPNTKKGRIATHRAIASFAEDGIDGCEDINPISIHPPIALSEKQRNQPERDMKDTVRLDDILNSPPSRTLNLARLKKKRNIQSRTSLAKRRTWGGDGFVALAVRIACSAFTSLVQSMDVVSFLYPSLDELKKVQIPTNFDDNLKKLKDGIPTFEEVKKAANDAIKILFRLISVFNESIGVSEFNRSISPIPELENLTFCSGNPKINNFYDDLESTVNKVKKTLIGVIICLVILAVIPMSYRGWWNWRSTQSPAFMLHTAPTYDPIDVIQIASRPYSSAGLFESSRRQILVRWAVAYATLTPALFVLSLGIAGLFGVLAQYLLLRQVESTAPASAAEVGEFADIVVKQLTVALTSWAVKTNAAINSTNSDINKKLFRWVVNGTDSLNDTLTVFVDTMYEGVDKFFGKTPLANPIKDVLNCLIGIKV
ncbi:hypothetical protein B9Z19DRAFT_1065587 [Tuber borchii]|uniref:Plasma membrane fusion protein PRM1 n=1 Tax=Tuber borchii TaxID=42251 RepID=A0A2T6ZQM9_TUBBO|nr:hypothetical protein B9Z19DRAFT_1065587 [Tuber borchii]